MLVLRFEIEVEIDVLHELHYAVAQVEPFAQLVVGAGQPLSQGHLVLHTFHDGAPVGIDLGIEEAQMRVAAQPLVDAVETGRMARERGGPTLRGRLPGGFQRNDQSLDIGEEAGTLFRRKVRLGHVFRPLEDAFSDVVAELAVAFELGLVEPLIAGALVRKGRLDRGVLQERRPVHHR